MNAIQLDFTLAQDFLPADTPSREAVCRATELLATRRGAGGEYLGWIDLPARTLAGDEPSRIESVARRLRSECAYVVCVGIGGSYLGARAVIEALSPLLKRNQSTQVLFAGHNLSQTYLQELLDLLGTAPFGIINISKSGTTTEPAVAFRFLRERLIRNVGREKARELIVAVTDPDQGALRAMAEQEGYESFIIPPSVGGRFSVLTPVGLLPIAVAGLDIKALLQGARDTAQITAPTADIEQNPAARYALTRYALYTAGKKIEMLTAFDTRLAFMGEWWKQLFAESEGKEGKGIFPATAVFTTDLHSVGQWIQQGERSLMETVVEVAHVPDPLSIPQDPENRDGLNYLAGRTVAYVNRQANRGTILAHHTGGVPVMRILLPRLDEYHLGALIYFFEMAVGISGYLLNINPFNQPGVEDYKQNMFALLQKPGYEGRYESLQTQLKNLVE